MPQKTLQQKTVTGISWNFVNQFGVQFLNLLFSIFLARLLSPTEYGLIAMVTVFTGFSAILLDFGFGNALIHKDNPTNVDWSSAFWLNTLMGLVLCLLLSLFSGTIAQFYNNPLLKSITIFLSINLVLNAMSITQNAQTRKILNFKGMAIVNVSSVLISGVIGITLAVMNYGVWSLVFQRITDSFCRFVGLLIITKWLPVYGFSILSIKNVMSYSMYLFGENFLGYWTRNLDNLLIGKYVSSTDLGLYSRAYSLLMFPVTSISAVISGVLFPSFSLIKNNKEKIKENFIKVTRMVAFIVFPIMFLLFICSKEVTLVVFGSQWSEMSIYLQYFSFLGMYQSIVSLNNPLYLALGKTKLNFTIGIISQIIVLVAMFIGLNWGVKGIIYSLCISTLINFYANNHFILKEINQSIFDRYKELFGIAVINVITFVIVLSGFYFLPLNLSMIGLLISKIVTYLVLYLLISKSVKLQEFNWLVHLIKSKIKS